MSGEATKETELELAHVLFIDIVGFSKRLINEQRALLDILNRMVRNTSPFRREEGTGKLRKIPTSDGLALVFYSAKKEPVECALERTLIDEVREREKHRLRVFRSLHYLEEFR